MPVFRNHVKERIFMLMESLLAGGVRILSNKVVSIEDRIRD